MLLAGNFSPRQGGTLTMFRRVWIAAWLVALVLGATLAHAAPLTVLTPDQAKTPITAQTVNGSATVGSQAVNLATTGVTGTWYVCTSASSTPVVRVEWWESPTVESTDFVQVATIAARLTSETAQLQSFSVTPLFARLASTPVLTPHYGRVLLLGDTGNPADTVCTVELAITRVDASGLTRVDGVYDTNGNLAKVGDNANSAVRVNVVAGAGSGGTAAADDSVFTGGATNVTPMGALYDTTPPTITDGRVGVPLMDSGRRLKIVCDSGCGGASPFEDEDAFTVGTTSINVTGYVVDETTPDSAPENSAAAPRMSPNRVPYSILRDAAGNERGANVTAGNALLVDGSAVTQPVSAASLPLPTGAATAANQDGIIRDGAGDTSQANVTSGRLHIDGSGVTQPVSGTVTANAGTNLNTSALALEAGGNLAGAATSLAILDDWDESDRAKVNLIVGQAGVAGGAGAVGATTQRIAIATGEGDDHHHLLSAASTNATNVKASAGTLYTAYVVNLNAAVRYIRFYNLSSAPTCSSGTGHVAAYPIPAATTGAGFALPLGPRGVAFGTGIGYCLTTGASPTDNNAVAANEIIVNLVYK